MKKLLCLYLAFLLCFCLLLSACGINHPFTREASPLSDSAATQESLEPLLPGKIAIITNTLMQNEEEYRSAQQVVEQYGEEYIIHQTWPDNFIREQEKMLDIVAQLGQDPEVKVLMINQAVPGSNAAIAQLRETRDDIFVIYSAPLEEAAETARLADLILATDEATMGTRMVEQAAQMGAKTFMYYTFPRHLRQPLRAAQQNNVTETCQKLGIEFVEIKAPDPTEDNGIPGAAQFMLEYPPRDVEKYGQDTAFFGTSCAMQVPLITITVELGAIYVQPCCPSPYHGFAAALGIDTGDNIGDLDYVISETRRIIAERGMSGRISTWPVSPPIMNTLVGVAYAQAWLAGTVPREGIDQGELQRLMEDYAEVPISLRAYQEEGQTYHNYQLYVMDYLVY